MMTIEESRADKFPFAIGDRIKIKWPRHPMETGTIHDLHKSTQWDTEVVHAIMVLIDGDNKPRVVCGSIIEKI